MKHRFLLIHGAWHGAWCWDRVINLLSLQGHSVKAIDLPGHGTGEKPGWHIGMQSYVDAVNDAARKLGESVHLVGHSMGGTVISNAAEQEPGLYSSLTYVTAFLLPSGESLLSASGKMDAPMMAKALKTPNLFKGYGKIKLTHSRAAFYNQCSDEDVKNSKECVCPQSIRPLVTKVKVSEERWGQIPRYYVFCENDQAIPIEGQRAFVEQLPCQKTLSINTDHSPFLSDTAQLTGALSDFAADAETLS